MVGASINMCSVRLSKIPGNLELQPRELETLRLSLNNLYIHQNHVHDLSTVDELLWLQINVGQPCKTFTCCL